MSIKDEKSQIPNGAPHHNLSIHEWLDASINNYSCHCLLVSGENELSFWCTSRLVGKVVETTFPEDQVATLPCRPRGEGERIK